ncbi:MlaD family protein [Pseudonocardia acaciae]|uniref:MlaD family protein n=1 Tax=Pseudonocardia acaciae TaxID=551276 RepID=UPI00048F66A8|nr:MlaD family protein [Pseudonocardia acaciae]
MAPSRHAARRFLIGLVALVAVLFAFYIAFNANQAKLPWQRPPVAKAAFTDIGQLQVGSEVRQNGVKVGTVSAIDLVNGDPVVSMELYGGVPMNRDGYAGIYDQSTLAQKFVELRPGTPASGPLGDAVLPVAQTESTHDLVQVLDVFDPATRRALGNALRQLGTGLAGYGPGLHEFVSTAPADLDNLGAISTTLTNDRTDLPKLLRTTDRLATRFAGREQQWTELLHQTDETLRALGVDDSAPLAATLNKLPPTLRAARGALDAANQPLADVATATGRLRSGAGSLGRATPDLRGVFREAPDPLAKVPGVADDVKPAADDLTHTLSDARPFVPRLGDGLASAAPPMRVIAPFAQDIGTFFTDIGTLSSSHDGWEHRFRIMMAMPSLTSLQELPVKDTANPYPVPGQPYRQRDPNGALVPGR